jgi:hypothetical protein
MSKPILRRLTFIAITVAAGSCVEEFKPVFELHVPDIIVIDSYLNATTGSAKARLSYTFNMDQDTADRVATNATITIESSDNTRHILSETSPGTYEAKHLAIDMNARYRIHVTTADERIFASDFVTVTKTPTIDSVYFRYHGPEPGVHGISIMIDTEATTSEGLHFFWDYEETWEYTVDWGSEFEFIEGQVVPRPVDKRIFVCYRTDPSPKILLGNTNGLSQDVIRNQALLWIPGQSQKLDRKYSINVRQRTIPKEAYEYWSRVKSTTEELGGLFDPPLSQVSGNIRNLSDPETPVVGYFSAGEISEQRLTFRYADLPDVILAEQRYSLCRGEGLGFLSVRELWMLTDDQVLVQALYTIDGTELRGYYFSTPRCADCRWQGGVITPPVFW